MRFANTITRASAGSGKTFALSNRYLSLLHEGESPETILATTFARKAAGEILDRILIRLAEAADDERQRSELASFVGGDALTPARCRQLLRQLGGNLHKLRVGTIDSFFAQIARSFALELGIPAAWQIIDEIEDVRLRDEAIERVLAEHDQNDLLQLVNLLTKGDAQRRISDLLRETVNDLYQVFLESDAQAWDKLPRYKPLDESALAAALEDLREPPVAGKAMEKACGQDYQRALSGDWKKFLGTGVAKCIVNGQPTYSRKEIEQPLIDIYLPLIEHAKAVLLGRSANFTIGARQFLSHFHQHYHNLKHRRRVMLFDDVTRAVTNIAQASDAEGVAYRLDAQLDHLLLDEFQDTSPPQWTAIEPLARRVVEGSASGGRSFYCVGDVKQAIFGWRGGVAEIFETVERQLGAMHHEELSKSYRSSPIIIETVNRVFAQLTDHPNLGRAADAVEAFVKAFPTHATAKTKLNGYACLMTAPRDDENQASATLKYAADHIAELVDETPGRSIGVLCRTNNAIAELIYQLRRRNIHASEEGGNPLTDSAAVQLVLALLKLADHPGDTVARHHLATSPLACVLKISNRRDGAAAQRLSREVRRELLEHGYGQTVLQWANRLSEQCDAREFNRLKQLVEFAYAHEATATLRCSDFIRKVQKQKVADPTAHQVRVTTIHRAKGLEFDIVVLPELDKSITGQPDRFVIHRHDATGPIDCIFEHIAQDLQPLLPKAFQEMIAEATHRDVTETLCVLYVALTRAVYALHMIIPPSLENEKTMPRKLSGLLRCALADGEAVGPKKIVWRHGDPRWFENPGDDKTTAAESIPATEITPNVKPLTVRVAPPLEGASRSLERIAPSRMHTSGTSLAQIFDEAENTYAKDRGSLIHACFEQIQWLDDGPPARANLQRIVMAQANGLLNANTVMDDIIEMLHRGETAGTLRRSHYEGQLRLPLPVTVLKKLSQQSLTPRVRPEYAFALADEAGRIVQGSIDRLVLLYDGDRLAAADVIDFKTDAKIDGAAKRHRQQLNAYRDAVSQSFRLPPTHIAARLLMVKEGQVVDIPYE